MDVKGYEAKIKTLLKQTEDDFAEIEEFIEENEDDFNGELEELVFRIAVRIGHEEYINEYVGDIELNDEGYYSTYFDETEDEDIHELLLSHGAFRDPETYTSEEYDFAMFSESGDVVTFKKEFQKKVFEKYKEENNLTDEKIIEILENEEDDEELECCVLEDMSELGIELKNNELAFVDTEGSDGYYFDVPPENCTSFKVSNQLVY